MKNLVEVTLKQGREKSVSNRHPWIYAGAIGSVSGRGSLATVRNSAGRPVAWGFFHPRSKIRIKILGWGAIPARPERVIQEKIRRAVTMRRDLLLGNLSAYRVIHAEGDGLPGLIADVYGEVMVLSVDGPGWDTWLEGGLLPHLSRHSGTRAIYRLQERNTQGKGGDRTGGKWIGGRPIPMPIRIMESGLVFLVDVESGQQSGFYLDQRANRALLHSLSGGREVLNLYSFTGAFSICALKGGARHVTNVDTSIPALDAARANHEANGIGDSEWIAVRSDAFEYVREMSSSGRKFDAVVLDPPPLARSKNQVDRACRAYKGLMIHAMKILRPGGLLFTFSRSGAVSRHLFRQVTVGAVLAAGVDPVILAEMGVDLDHPISCHCPQSEYLKGLLLRL